MCIIYTKYLNKGCVKSMFYIQNRSMDIMKKRIKLSLYHAIYVAGMTFFSTLGTKFLDETITLQELQFCFFATFIALGLAFFSSINLQRMNGCYQEPYPDSYRYHQKQKRIKVRSANNDIKSENFIIRRFRSVQSHHRRFLNNVLVITHSHTNLHKNGCIL